MAISELDVCRWWWPTYFPGDGDESGQWDAGTGSGSGAGTGTGIGGLPRSDDGRLEHVAGVVDWFNDAGPTGGASFIADVRTRVWGRRDTGSRTLPPPHPPRSSSPPPSPLPPVPRAGPLGRPAHRAPQLPGL
jgi:hypothetical protein